MAIINGTNGPDGSAFYGGAGNDSISLFDGNDFAWGQDGDDTIRAGAGDDTIYVTQDTGFTGFGEIYDGGTGTDMLLVLGFQGGSTFNSAYYNWLPSVVQFISLETFRIGSLGGRLTVAINYTDFSFTNVYGNPFGSEFDGTQRASIIVRAEFEITDMSGVNVRWFSSSDDHNFTVQGRAQADYILGPNGFAGEFGSRLRGEGGNDTLFAGNANDTVWGGADNDWIRGNLGDDVLLGEAGDDTLDGGAGNDTMYAGDGFDMASYANASGGVTADLSANNSSGADGVDFLGDDIEGLIGSAHNDDLFGDENNNRLEGGAGDDDLRATGTATDGGNIINSDTLLGGDGNDLLRGSDGGDSLDGGNGDDVLRGNGGNDTLNGGFGTDLVSYLNATSAVNVSLLSGFASGGDGSDQLISIEGISGSNFSDFLQGTGANEQFFGNNGDDTVRAGGGNDTIYVGDGFNNVYGDAGNDIIFGSNESDNLIGSTESDDSVSVDQDSIDGFGGDDAIYGSNGNDTLRGGDGNDFIRGHRGNDIIDGGAGNDAASYRYATSGVTVNLTTGLASGPDGADTLIGIETIYASDHNDTVTGTTGSNFMDGGAGNDVFYASSNTNGDDSFAPDTMSGGEGQDFLFGSDGSDALYGGNGDDHLRGNGGNDTISGGDGVDLASYVSATGGVDVSLITNLTSGADGVDTLTSIENVWGTNNHDDTIVGNDIANQLLGNGGDDILSGRGGNDQIYGGTGNDTIDGGEGNDALVGNAGDDVITGGLGDDTIDGFGDDDRLSGEGGNDLVRGNVGNDIVGGEAGNDTVIGGSGNDSVYGGAGNDLVSGGTGDDLLNGGAGFDTADYSYVTDNLIANINFGGAQTISAIAGRDTFVSVEGLLGGSGNDLLVGSSGGNVIDGGAGDDEIYGIGGGDILRGGTGNDLVEGSGGNDTMEGGAGDADVLSYFNSAGGVIVNLRFQGTAQAVGGSSGTDTFTLFEDLYGSNAGGDTLVGDTGDNRMLGFGGDDLIFGYDGDDDLIGMQGNDTLNGGLGADTLSGGGGADTFDFNSVAESTFAERDTITDFDVGGAGTVDLSTIDANSNLVGNQAFNFIGTAGFTNTAGELRFVTNGMNGFVLADVNGNGNADLNILLMGVTSMNASDFVF